MWKVSILTEIAASHAEAGRKDQAHKTLRLALDAARGAPNDALWTYSSSFVERMLDPSLPVLQTSAHAHARIGDVEVAMKTVAGMSQSTMGTFTRDQSVKQIVTTLLEKSDIAGARRTVELIPDSGSFTVSKADVVEQIAKRQAEQGDAAGQRLRGRFNCGSPGQSSHARRGLADGVVQRCTVQGFRSLPLRLQAQPRRSDQAGRLTWVPSIRSPPRPVLHTRARSRLGNRHRKSVRPRGWPGLFSVERFVERCPTHPRLTASSRPPRRSACL